MNVNRPSTQDNPPIVTIDVPAKALDEIEGLNAGDSVRVVLVGTVAEVTQRDASTVAPHFAGTLRLEVTRTQVTRQDSAFSDLADDE